MADPAKIAFSSIYDSFKNNDYHSGSITVSGVVPPVSPTIFTATFNLDREESVTEIYFITSVNSVFYATGSQYVLLPETSIFHDNGSAPPSFPVAEYSIFFETAYSSGSLTINLQVTNTHLDPMTVATETIDFEVYTFIGPFKST